MPNCKLLFAFLFWIPTIAFAESFDWSAFEGALENNVSPGTRYGIQANLVDYQALLQEQSFINIAQQLDTYDPGQLPRRQKLAFYINAYNYFAIKIILDNWPVEGIKDIGSIFRPVWEKPVGKINGQTLTLDAIEHEILRPMDEPRMHFAIVCASMSCPDLRTEIYRAEDLEQQLDQQVQAFLNNPSKGARIENGKLYLSKIFSWFEEDFDRAGGVLSFVAQYQEDTKRFNDFTTIDYDWRLNRVGQ